MIVPFPKDSMMITAAFEVFKGSRESLIVIAPLIFVGRALMNMATMQGHAQHGKVVTDTLLFFIGMYCLESILLLIMEIPAQASELIANKEPLVLDKIPGNFYFLTMSIAFSDIVDYVTVFIFNILSLVYLFFMSFAIMLGAYVVFFATMFQVRKVFTIFIMIIFFLSLWPFLWYSMDRTFEYLLKNQNNNGSVVGAAISVLVLGALKLILPVAGFLAAIKTPTSFLGKGVAAIKSPFTTTKNLADKSAKTVRSISRPLGIGKTADYLTTPLRSSASKKVSSARSTATHTLGDVAPFAAYKTSQLLGSKAGRGSFAGYKRGMARAAKKSSYQKTGRAQSSDDRSLFVKKDADSKSGSAPINPQRVEPGALAKSSREVPSNLKSRSYIPKKAYKEIDSHFKKNKSYEGIQLSRGSQAELANKNTTLSEGIEAHQRYQHNLKVRNERGF